MPEGEGYQPTPEELQTGEENREELEITERAIREKSQDGHEINGIQHEDVFGRVIFRREDYDSGRQQAIQYEYQADGGVIEQAKMMAGPEQGRELKREHPMSAHQIEVFWEDLDLGQVNEKVPVILESLGQTTAGEPVGDRQPWAHFEVSNPAELEVFSDVTPAAGSTSGVLRGTLSKSFSLEVNGRNVDFDPISKISVDFGPDGRPVKATFHCYGWTENQKPEQVTA